MVRLMQWVVLLWLVIMPAPVAYGQGAPAVDPPPPLDLDQTVGLGRPRIVSRLEGGQNAHALVIGVEQFDKEPWKRLTGVKAEADAVALALAVHGFNVTRVQGERDAAGNYNGRVSAQQMRAEIAGFVRRYGKDRDNRLVIYVASHGLAVEPSGATGSSEKTGYIIATDTLAASATTFAASAVSITTLQKEIAEVQARHLLLAFNTCFSGALVPSDRTRSADVGATGRPAVAPLASEVADWVETLLAKPAHLVMTAGDSSQTVPDEDAAFGRAFVEGLYGAADLDGDGLILAAELGQHVRARVAKETYKAGRPNDPLFIALPYPGGMDQNALGGDFVFLSPRGPAGAEVRLDNSALERRRSTLPGGAFTDCLDCPVMTDLSEVRQISGKPAPRIAVGKTEVTSAQWNACFRQGFCRRWKSDAAGGDQPVSHVTWADALDYVDFLNAQDRPGGKCKLYRLPGREEWLMAARGGTETRFTWGDRPVAARANCAGCGSAWDRTGPAPAASFPPNAYGLHDMVGNLWEWVATPGPCGAVDLAAGRCGPGLVMGGAYSTHIDAITLASTDTRDTGVTQAPMPRPGVRRGLKDAGWPTVGLRVACDLDGSKGP